MSRASLRSSCRDLALVAGGAVPGALLRWQLQTMAVAVLGDLPGQRAGTLIANLLGCLLLGLLSTRHSSRPRLVLWGGIGFCGSLTTFSSWMLELVQTLQQQHPLNAVGLLLLHLTAGLALVALGQRLGRSSPSTDPARRAGR